MNSRSRLVDVLAGLAVVVVGMPFLAGGGLGLVFELTGACRAPTLVTMTLVAAVGFLGVALGCRLLSGGPARPLLSPYLLMGAGAAAGAFGYLALLAGPAAGVRAGVPLWLVAAGLLAAGAVRRSSRRRGERAA